MTATQEFRIKVCFLVESTYRMDGWADHIWEFAEDTLKDLQKKHPYADIEAASVEYKDYGDPDQVSCTLFTDVTTFLTVFSELRLNMNIAQFNQDEAEDVAGGLHAAANTLNWRDADVKLLYHIGMSPCHGAQFHDESISDNYPAGDPQGLDPLHELQLLVAAGVQYWFVRISSDTDIMVDQFQAAYGDGVFYVMDVPDEDETSQSDGPDSVGE